MENPVEPSLQIATKIQFSWRKIVAFPHKHIRNIKHVSEAFVWMVDTTPIITRLYLISGFGE